MSERTGENNMKYLEPKSPDGRPSRCNLLPVYNQLNQMYFDGELPKIPVVFNGRLQSVYGRCHAIRRKNLVAHKIDIKYPIVSQRMLRKVMVHEMCHAWTIKNIKKEGHTSLFWKKMSECGYPDGHQFANALPEEKDKYDSDKNKYHPFVVGQVVSFINKRKKNVAGFYPVYQQKNGYHPDIGRQISCFPEFAFHCQYRCVRYLEFVEIYFCLV